MIPLDLPLPSGWGAASLKEIAVDKGLVSGPFGSAISKKYFVEEGVPVIRGSNLSTDGWFRDEGFVFITDDRADELANAEVLPGDLVFTAAGTLGQIGLLPSTVRFPRYIASNKQLRARVDPDLADARYVFYWFRIPSVADFVASMNRGSSVPLLTLGVLKDLPVPLPPLEEQRRIADFIESIDVLIDNNRRRIEILEEMARLIYREWFVHFRFPGHEDVELVDSDLGPIPGGWEAVPLSELVTTQYGYTESAQEEPVGPRYLRGMDMNKSSFIDWSAVPYCPISDRDRQKFKVEVGDVFVIRMADPGKVGICEREVDAVFASYLVRLKPADARLLPYYLFFTLSDDRYQGWVIGASTGATRKSVSAKVMTEPPVVLPPRDVQALFVGTVAPIRGLLTNLLEQNGVLIAARDLLLPRLISGELDVSDLDLSLEPAA